MDGFVCFLTRSSASGWLLLFSRTWQGSISAEFLVFISYDIRNRVYINCHQNVFLMTCQMTTQVDPLKFCWNNWDPLPSPVKGFVVQSWESSLSRCPFVKRAVARPVHLGKCRFGESYVCLVWCGEGARGGHAGRKGDQEGRRVSADLLQEERT